MCVPYFPECKVHICTLKCKGKKGDVSYYVLIWIYPNWLKPEKGGGGATYNLGNTVRVIVGNVSIFLLMMAQARKRVSRE